MYVLQNKQQKIKRFVVQILTPDVLLMSSHKIEIFFLHFFKSKLFLQ